MNNFMFTLFDVEHGLSIWIQTPNGQNHFIDIGKNNDSKFSPYKHINKKYKIKSSDLLIISNPDKDHIEGLPDFINYLGEPQEFIYNYTLSEDLKFGQCEFDYQKEFEKLVRKHPDEVDFNKSKLHPFNNGGVQISIIYNDYSSGMSKNDTSIVAFYEYLAYLFVMPGDIDPGGWSLLMENYDSFIKSCIFEQAYITILVAPHHGQESGFSQEMIDYISPNIILVSDKYGNQKTDTRFYEKPSGVLVVEKGSIFSTIKCLSTKTNGKISFCIDDAGECWINYNNHTHQVWFD